ncbi:MAG: hypothetical protein AB7O26_12430 [Planctomycetaceae bacterium]
MDQKSRKISRPTVGVIAIALLGGGVVLSLLPTSAAEPQWELWRGACVRVGLVMAALWLALPSIQNDNPFVRTMGITVVAIILLGVFLKRVPLRFIIPGALAVMALSVILRPRPKRRPDSRL